MALTPEQIYGLRVRSGMDAFRPMKEHWQAKDDDAAYRFARAIEAEVRKDDEALIRQMMESMCWAARVMTISEDEAPGYFAAITAARARLEQP